MTIREIAKEKLLAKFESLEEFSPAAMVELCSDDDGVKTLLRQLTRYWEPQEIVSGFAPCIHGENKEIGEKLIEGMDLEATLELLRSHGAFSMDFACDQWWEMITEADLCDDHFEDATTYRKVKFTIQGDTPLLCAVWTLTKAQELIARHFGPESTEPLEKTPGF